MTDTSTTPSRPVCAICGSSIERESDALVTVTGVLHIACVEQSAAAA